MPLERIRAARRRAVGTKQTLKAAVRGLAAEVFVARDAEEHVVRGVIQACRDRGITITYVDTMAELGRACGIKVGAASAAILKEGGAEHADDQPVGP
ncbi:MAG: ribosomal L7Ae/L30e/S12e/Gadd45 family protein [Thermaerobacter sp.]|nr:50S ribosomal protein L7Ae-like protein [Bacillota bacterium]REJ38229.1 MAG: 50S ribosomal protein L7Ae-like protein [Bacillota bacterium]